MKDTLGNYLMQWRIRTVMPYISGRLLDIGCGTNNLVAAYEGDGTGVDVYPWDNVDIVVKNTAELPFDDCFFDTITIIAALNHIPNRGDVLLEAHRLLKEDGTLLITMIPPIISTIWHFLRRPWDADQSERKMKDGEVYGLLQSDVLNLLDKAGFCVSNVKLFMFGINRLSIARKCKGV